MEQTKFEHFFLFKRRVVQICGVQTKKCLDKKRLYYVNGLRSTVLSVLNSYMLERKNSFEECIVLKEILHI